MEQHQYFIMRTEIQLWFLRKLGVLVWVANTVTALMRSQDGKVSQHSCFTCTVNFQPNFSKPYENISAVSHIVSQLPLGECLYKYFMVQNLVWQKWKAKKLNTIHAKILERITLANLLFAVKVLPTGRKDDLNVFSFNLSCFFRNWPLND